MAIKVFELGRVKWDELTVDERNDVAAQVVDMFQYHPWDDIQKTSGELVRATLADAAFSIIKNCPPCADRSTALRKIREARMDANSAITHKGAY